MMSKNKKKTKEIEYAVKYLHETKKMEPTKIALELGIQQAIVEGIVNAPKEDKPRRESKSQNMMIRKSSGKGINNVSIMTEGASQLNDELTRNNLNHQSRSTKNAIFRPNE